MQRQLNNFSPSLKVSLTRTRQGPVSMILNINNGNVAWKRISTSPDFSERTEEKCSNKINEESKAFFHINTVHTILHHTTGSFEATPWMRFRFYFSCDGTLQEGQRGRQKNPRAIFSIMSLPRLTFLSLDLNENECVPVTDLYQRYLITFHKIWKVNNAFYILFHSGRLTVKQGMTCNPVYLCFTEHWDSN